jgi:PEP-CTERM motif
MRFQQLNHLIGLAALAAALAGTSAAHALTFDLTYDPSLSAFGANEAALEAATQDVANEYSALYTNKVTVNIDVKVDPDPKGLGSSQFENNDTGTISYAQLKAALESHASTAASKSAIASLPAADPTNGAGLYLTNAEAKALGFTSGDNSALDGTFFIGAANTYTFDPNDRAVAGAFDYLGTAEHEFSEIMGRVTQLNNDSFGTTAFDLFRYSAPGVTTLNPNATGLYFSDDGGKTVVNTFNPPGNGGDIQDWAGSTPPDSFDAFGDTGEAEPMHAYDQIVMNTLGWTSAAVPEPGTWALMLIGFGGLGAAMRSRRKAIATA